MKMRAITKQAKQRKLASIGFGLSTSEHYAWWMRREFRAVLSVLGANRREYYSNRQCRYSGSAADLKRHLVIEGRPEFINISEGKG